MSDTVSKEWYVIHTYSGYENKVKDNIEKELSLLVWKTKFFRIVVPEEKRDNLNSNRKEKKKLIEKHSLDMYLLS